MSAVLRAIQVTGVRRVQAFPAFESHAQLVNFLARASWHFAHVPGFELHVPLVPNVSVPKRLQAPAGFDPAVQGALDAYLPRVRFHPGQAPEQVAGLLADADVVLKWVEGREYVDRAIRDAGKFVYRVDPVKVRQEGSYFIQCAFDLYRDKEAAIEDCARKFSALADRIGRHRRAWVLATGPSVESYADNDYGDSVVIACNSVVLNEDLMRVCKPSVLVFADPIFHFGVSGYAGRFREAIEQRLLDSDISIVVPFKYYPLMIAKFPSYAHRIIGVPFEKMRDFNLDIVGDFRVKTTSNILTLLLLPLAATFASEIHLTGCDGRPLERDDYFWGHGASVQINDKMENIQQVHPGFFAIDYNEYYFEHCHTLENLLVQAEREGRRLAHHGMSHIPALRDRVPERLQLSLAEASWQAAEAKRGSARVCLVLEPDGLGMDGHYVRWHRNLVGALSERFERVEVLCGREQDPALYGCPAHAVFTERSWSVARSNQSTSADFQNFKRFQSFLAELKQAVRELYSPLPRELSIYMYYGSVQFLKLVQILRADLLKEGCELKAFICLFHETVIMDPARQEPRFPPNAGQVLMQAAAQNDVYRVASATERLAELIMRKYGVVTEVFTNPVPGLSDEECGARLNRQRSLLTVPDEEEGVVILVPTRPREEKGSSLVSEFIRHLECNGVPEGHRYLVRGDPPKGRSLVAGVEYLGNELSDEAYWANLDRADIMIAPYLAPCFTFRTSGILVDALMTGTPSIVVSDTWLADVVDELGVGISISPLGPLSIASAIKVLLAHRASMRERIETGAVRYLARNTWRSTANFAAV